MGRIDRTRDGVAAEHAHAADRFAREIVRILTVVAVRLRRLMGRPLGHSHQGRLVWYTYWRKGRENGRRTMHGWQPSLLVLGGYPGSGKTSIARRLAVDFQLARLSSDAIAQTITASSGLQGYPINATWTAYDVIFALCTEFLQAGVSTLLKVN